MIRSTAAAATAELAVVDVDAAGAVALLSALLGEAGERILDSAATAEQRSASRQR